MAKATGFALMMQLEKVRGNRLSWVGLIQTAKLKVNSKIKVLTWVQVSQQFKKPIQLLFFYGINCHKRFPILAKSSLNLFLIFVNRIAAEG